MFHCIYMNLKYYVIDYHVSIKNFKNLFDLLLFLHIWHSIFKLYFKSVITVKQSLNINIFHVYPAIIQYLCKIVIATKPN